MDAERLNALLEPYNPWWQPGSTWESGLPDYRRPIVEEVLSDLRDLPQMISITGPRRVGKSTAARHLISRLVREQQSRAGQQTCLHFLRTSMNLRLPGWLNRQAAGDAKVRR